MNITKEHIRTLFDSFKEKKIMIIGDVMLDLYLKGKVDRISPEAPVPIVSVKERFSRLGGAANVAQNIKSLGAEPILCAVSGNDSKADDFFALMKEHDLPTHGMIRSDDRVTTTKYRIIGNNAQMLRVDSEDTFDLTTEELSMMTHNIKHIIETEKIDGIILQDYNKGVLTDSLIVKTIELALENNIPVAVDPKKNNFLAYKNVTLFKPNLKELKEGLNGGFPDDNIEGILVGVKTLQEKLCCKYVMATLSERGIIIRENGSGEHHHIPAFLRKIADVSGAGDTVLSVAMLCLVCNQDSYLIAALSNLAGGLVCEEIGAVPVDRQRLLEEAEKLYIN